MKEVYQWKEYLQHHSMQIALVCSVVGMLWLHQGRCPDSSSQALSQQSTVQSSGTNAVSHGASIDTSKLHDECFRIPNMRPSGVFFADTQNKYHDLPSIEGVEPAFRVGTYFQKGNMHMGGDLAHFQLIGEEINKLENVRQYNENTSRRTSNDTIMSLDIGANQGFYTFFLAALGLQVHAFEIDQTNFQALQQGTLYNTKEVADRVYLYPVGLSDTVGRMGSKGSQYEGFLQKDNAGPILSSTLDCFAYHSNLLQRLLPSPNNDGKRLFLPFVKIDVEGFEISVLKGVHNSLYHPFVTIGSLLVEVGPKRWSRASVQLQEGIEEMKLLASQFTSQFLILKGPSVGHAKSCPLSLADVLSGRSKKPERELHGVQLHRITDSEDWVTLLTAMEKDSYDCNFWYTN